MGGRVFVLFLSLFLKKYEDSKGNWEFGVGEPSCPIEEKKSLVMEVYYCENEELVSDFLDSHYVLM